MWLSNKTPKLKEKGVLIKNDDSQRAIISLVYAIFCSFLLLKCHQDTWHTLYYSLLGKHSLSKKILNI